MELRILHAVSRLRHGNMDIAVLGLRASGRYVTLLALGPLLLDLVAAPLLLLLFSR